MDPQSVDVLRVLNKKIAVRCETEYEAVTFIQAVLELSPSNKNRHWRELCKKGEVGWTSWTDSDTCYDIECDYDICYCNADWYLEHGYEVVDFSSIHEEVPEMEDVDTQSFLELFSEGVVL